MQPTNGGKEGDDSSGGREGEKGGGLLLNYSISGDHPGLILYRDDEDVKLSKRFARWCLFSIVCYVYFWEFCWAQIEMFDLKLS